MHELNSKEILFNDQSECKLEKQDIAATNKQIIPSFDYQTKFFSILAKTGINRAKLQLLTSIKLSTLRAWEK